MYDVRSWEFFAVDLCCEHENKETEVGLPAQQNTRKRTHLGAGALFISL